MQTLVDFGLLRGGLTTLDLSHNPLIDASVGHVCRDGQPIVTGFTAFCDALKAQTTSPSYHWVARVRQPRAQSRVLAHVDASRRQRLAQFVNDCDSVVYEEGRSAPSITPPRPEAVQLVTPAAAQPTEETVLAENRKLQSLNLGGSNLANFGHFDQALLYFCNALCTATHLCSLGLADNWLGSGAPEIARALARAVRHRSEIRRPFRRLDLSNNWIGAGIAGRAVIAALAEMIATDGLEEIDLSANRLAFPDADYVSKLQNHGFAMDGICAIVRSIESSSTLKVVKVVPSCLDKSAAESFSAALHNKNGKGPSLCGLQPDHAEITYACSDFCMGDLLVLAAEVTTKESWKTLSCVDLSNTVSRRPC